jgi:hypothetical protein
MECPNCEQETDRLIECALLRLPVDLSDFKEGDSFSWTEPNKLKINFDVVERNVLRDSFSYFDRTIMPPSVPIHILPE